MLVAVNSAGNVGWRLGTRRKPRFCQSVRELNKGHHRYAQITFGHTENAPVDVACRNVIRSMFYGYRS